MASRERLLDAEFLEGAAEDWECPVCKLTLLDPFLLSCCGNHLCESCVGRLADKPCPLCSHTFTGLLDKGRQRGVWQAKVRCSNHNGGCEWQGELRYLLRHLQPADGEGGESLGPRGSVPLCVFEPVPCANEGCGQRLPRKDLEQHQQSECVHRKVRCQYCNEVETTYEELCNTHWGECPNYPVKCPNNCDVGDMRRSQVQTHCDRDCKLQPVKCPFFDLGCPAKQRPRKELQNHVNTAQLFHGQLLARKIIDIQAKQEAVVTKEEVERVTVAMQEQLRQRDEIIQRLSTEAGEIMTEFTKFVEDTNARFEAIRGEFAAFQASLEEKQNAKEEEFNGKLKTKDEELKKQDEKIEKLEKELAQNCQRLEQVGAELEERLADVDREQATRLEELNGEMEKMRLELQDKEKEERGQVEKLISELEEKLMEQIDQKQPKDEFVKLENGLANVARLVEETEEKFTAQIEDVVPKRNPIEEREELLASVEQILDEKLKTHTAEYEKQKEEMREGRADIEEMFNEFSEEMNGKVEDVVERQAEVKEELETAVGRVRQELMTRVDEVIREVEYVEKAATPTPPFSFTVSRFTKRREKKDSFVSEPFYTSRRGYRMVVRVDAAGTDTHVSVWCCITRGQHDNIIPWPLRADIFIRLINQRDKDKYYERQISYDHVARDKHAGRVFTGDKNYLWGLREFITLREIQSSQYLVGDALDFVVDRVELKEMDRPL